MIFGVPTNQDLATANQLSRCVSDKDRSRNNCRLPDVEHVFNVLGTMESCPTYFCSSPKAVIVNLLKTGVNSMVVALTAMTPHCILPVNGTCTRATRFQSCPSSLRKNVNVLPFLTMRS